MSDPVPSFAARFALAFVAFFRVLFDGAFAAGVERVRSGALPAPKEKEPEKLPPPPKVEEVKPTAALQLLGLLQREGRFVDFLEEDVTSFSDADIGAAARVVHQGCRKTLREHFTLSPVRTENEGERVTLAEGFDANAIRLTGNVVGKAPYTGTLQHRGWKVVEIELPKVHAEHDASVIAPAEVEL